MSVKNSGVYAARAEQLATDATAGLADRTVDETMVMVEAARVYAELTKAAVNLEAAQLAAQTARNYRG